MNRKNRLRAVMLIDMIVTLIIVTILMTIVGQMLIGMLRTGRDIADKERDSAQVDRAVSQLRRDVLRTMDGRPEPTAIGVDLQDAHWSVEGDTLVRRPVSGNVERFGPLAEAPAIKVDDRIVLLTIGRDTWSMRPVVLAQEGEAR